MDLSIRFDKYIYTFHGKKIDELDIELAGWRSIEKYI
jgi:hypothetical protein